MSARLFVVKKWKLSPPIYAQRCEGRPPGLVVTQWTEDPAKARTFTLQRARAVASRNPHCAVAVQLPSKLMRP